MTWEANVANPKKEKHTLVVVRPRIRQTGWELYQDNDPIATYRTYMPHGFVTRVWNELDTVLGADGIFNSASLALVLINNGSWYYDYETKYLYYTDFKVGGLWSLADPDGNDLPGLTVEFELNISDQTFVGPRDPLDATSQKVNWIGCLEAAPLAQSGSRQNVYGFFPVNSSALQLKNSDGWMNEFLYDATFRNAVCNAYIMTNADLAEAIDQSEVRQVFIGYTRGMNMREFDVTLDCVDILSFFDKRIPLRKMNEIDLIAYQPDLRQFLKQEFWFIRRIFGRVLGHRPINIDFDYTPGTSVNRQWLTHEADEAIGSVSGSRVFLDDGTLTYSIDTGGSNSATRTYLTTAPQCMVGDGVIIKRSGTDRYAKVTAIGANYIDHDAIAGSAAGGDTVTRPFVALVTITNSDGDRQEFLPGRDYDLLIDDTEDNRLRGFTLHNNVESGMAGAPLDPVSWDVSCTVYGRKELDQYLDSSDVDQVSDRGGIMAGTAGIIYRLLVDSGFPRAQIDEDFFQLVDDDSLSCGFAIPHNRDTLTAPSYNEVLAELLQSNLYKMFVSDGVTGVGLAISETKPFETSGDFSSDELQHRGMDFEHDYDQIYSEVELSYNRAEDFDSTTRNEFELENQENLAAKNVHFVDRKFTSECLLYSSIEATRLAKRMAFILGERRGYWTFDFELDFITKANLGNSYRIYRQQMPGFPFVENTQRSQELSVIEVNKNSNGVTMTLEDQKGIQDNSGDW